MKKKISGKSSLTSLLLITSILVSVLIRPVLAQEKAIVISIGQPNIWSLEQAHYLLARMHRQNLDLQTKSLGEIDPNEINSQSISVVRQLISAGFKFDEAVGINNELLKSDKSFNSGRRQELLTQRSTLQSQKTQVSREITALKIAKSKATDETEKATLQEQIDAKTEEKTAIEDELENVNDELSGLSSATGDFKSVDGSTEGFDKTKLPESSKLDALIPTTRTNPSIAASQRLENYIGMQYEIIAKQLTLLRDEVGPGERLVFLELPQSINLSQDQEKNKYYQALRGIAGMSTNDSADNKMAQVWWRVAGYTRVDKNKLLEEELKKLGDQINNLRKVINPEQPNTSTEPNQQKNPLTEVWETLSNKREQLTRRLEKLYTEKKALEERKEKVIEERNREEKKSVKDILEDELKSIAQDLELLEGTIKDTIEAIQIIKYREYKIEKEQAKLVQSLAALTTKYEKLQIQVERNKLREQQKYADRLLQGGGQKTATIVDSTMNLLNQEPGSFVKALDASDQKRNDDQQTPSTEDNKKEPRQYVSLIENYTTEKRNLSDKRENLTKNPPGVGYLRNRAVRVIDIIPRQNAINVDTTKESVKATGIVGAFSFLFGFGGNVRYQRQKEEFDAFLNQELYTSGFGKGQTDFGWSFFPFSNTKQLAPGVRTTYAVAIIPDDAESVVLRAKGCYFPRREKQPLNYNATMTWKDSESSSCYQEQVFVLPVPGGSGQGADFYINEIRYSPNRGNGERMVASIYGENISPQTGVTVNGVALREAVGLAQTNIESILGDSVKEICEGSICGRFERVSPNQLVISFKMPDGYNGTPRISLVAPGKAIEINTLYLNVNGNEDAKLSESEYMFGTQPSEAPRSISDLKVAPDPSNRRFRGNPQMIGVVTGKYDPTDTFYVNGSLARIVGGSCKTGNLCIIEFPIQKTDFLTVTLVPSDPTQNAVSKTFVNPAQLKIINATVVRYKEETDKTAAVLTVKIDGSGFSASVIPSVNAPAAITSSKTLLASSGQMIIEITSPTPVTNITLTDKNTNNSVSTIVTLPK